MKYALNLADDGRILSATYEEFDSSPNPILVDKLPEGNIYDYIYKNGTYTYDPIPETVVPEPEDPIEKLQSDNKELQAKVKALTESNQMLEDCIVEMAEIVYA